MLCSGLKAKDWGVWYVQCAKTAPCWKHPSHLTGGTCSKVACRGSVHFRSINLPLQSLKTEMFAHAESPAGDRKGAIRPTTVRPGTPHRRGAKCPTKHSFRRWVVVIHSLNPALGREAGSRLVYRASSRTAKLR